MWRGVLLAVGCVPMIAVHGKLSYLMIFPLVSLAAGDLRQGVFLVWWLAGSAGLGVLVFSCATFRWSPRRLPGWQVFGLLVGILASAPLILGFAGVWWAAVGAVVASCTAVCILVGSEWNRRDPVVGPGRNTGIGP